MADTRLRLTNRSYEKGSFVGNKKGHHPVTQEKNNIDPVNPMSRQRNAAPVYEEDNDDPIFENMPRRHLRGGSGDNRVSPIGTGICSDAGCGL
jgi:hypothetical protein